MPRPVAALLALSLALLSNAALAGPAPDSEPTQDQVRYQRSAPSAKPRVRTPILEQRFEQAKQAQAQANAEVEQARAEDFHRRHQEAREQAMVDDQIALLKRLIKATEPDDIEMADLLFRLADLYLEKKAYHDLQAGALYEKIAEAEVEAD